MNDIVSKRDLASAVECIIRYIGDDPDRPGLKKTPIRVINMLDELFEGMRFSNDDIIKKYNTTFEEVHSGDLVVVSNIPCFSMCEHHLMLMYNMHIAVGYIPREKVIGLSKITRISNLVCRRLQLQERIGEDIMYILKNILGTDDVIVVIEAEHGCMTARGVNKPGTCTRTAALNGMFKNNGILRQEFYNLIK